MTGLVGLELGSRILGFADFIVAAAKALMKAAAVFHLGRLNSVIIFIIIIFFSSSSSPSSPSTPTFKVEDLSGVGRRICKNSMDVRYNCNSEIIGRRNGG